MFGFNCIGYGIQNAGWNHHWMYPGPCFGPVGFGYRGYNPRVSDGVMLGQSILSGVNGLIAGLDARYNRGYSSFDAARIGIGTAAVGTNNALWGNMMDKWTHSYTGSIMSSTMMAFNPFASFVTPYVRPFGGPFGCGLGFYC